MCAKDPLALRPGDTDTHTAVLPSLRWAVLKAAITEDRSSGADRAIADGLHALVQTDQERDRTRRRGRRYPRSQGGRSDRTGHCRGIPA